jgi:hypothetical protein
VNEGYCLEFRSEHLLVNHIPYLAADGAVTYGTLASKLTVSGDRTGPPADHVAYFIGGYPCDEGGAPIAKLNTSRSRVQLAGDLWVDGTFSSKPYPSGRYDDYYDKMTTYVGIVSGPAQKVVPEATARTFAPIVMPEDEGVFCYFDSASSRAGTSAINGKLEQDRIAIVGLGGSGSYVLDLLAKAPAREIHIFDGDTFFNHNAFRSPGAPSVEELRESPTKVEYLRQVYSKMRRGIVAHHCFIDGTNVDDLRGMNFVFLCMDSGTAKRDVVLKLREWGIPFVDVGIGLELVNGALTGQVRVTTCPPGRGDQIFEKKRIPFAEVVAENDYASNIQIADMNALSACLAVIKWKKLRGFYHDLESENFCVYVVTGNCIQNEDQE